MIKPTVGRVVLFTPSTHADPRFDRSQPLSATVAYVWNDRLVNLVVFDQAGNPSSATSVVLLQDNDEPNINGYYAEWMDYQKGQAARAEAAEAKLMEGQREPMQSPT